MNKIDDARVKWHWIGIQTNDDTITPTIMDEAGQAILDAVEVIGQASPYFFFDAVTPASKVFDPVLSLAFHADENVRAIQYPSGGSRAIQVTDSDVIIYDTNGQFAYKSDNIQRNLYYPNGMGFLHADANLLLLADQAGGAILNAGIYSRSLYKPNGDNAIYIANGSISFYAQTEFNENLVAANGFQFLINNTAIEIMRGDSNGLLINNINGDQAILVGDCIYYYADELHNGGEMHTGINSFQEEADFYSSANFYNDTEFYANGFFDNGVILNQMATPSGGYDGQVIFTGSALKVRINGIWKTIQVA